MATSGRLLFAAATACLLAGHARGDHAVPVVIESLGPVLPNETVVSVVPGFGPNQLALLPTNNSAVDLVSLCNPAGNGCRGVAPLRVSEGYVHWVLPPSSPLDEHSYSVGGGKQASLNHAQLWWSQCVDGDRLPAAGGTAAASTNGMACAGGGVLRLFGKGLAFSAGSCAPYVPYTYPAPAAPTGRASPPATQIRLTPVAVPSGGRARAVAVAVAVVAAARQSCYDASFLLPRTLPAGDYTLEVKSNLPSATWQRARDPDQHTVTLAGEDLRRPHGAGARLKAPCDTRGKVFPAHDRASLLAALAAAGARRGGGTVSVAAAAAVELDPTDALVLPECTTLSGGAGASRATLVWKASPGAPGTNCGGHGKPLISTDTHGAGVGTVEDLNVVAVALKGCGGIVGSSNGVGFTMRNVNITHLADMATAETFASAVSLSNASHFLIEGCTILQCGNNTPGGAHSDVQTPIARLASASNGVIRNNMWMVGLSGWNSDKSWHIVQESNVYTGYFNNDVTKPLPNFDGSFWFSSYGQGPFPGAGRFFYANTTQNERPHTKPQVGGGESFTLDGGNAGGYYGGIDEDTAHHHSTGAVGPSASDRSVPAPPGGGDGRTLTFAGDVCWQHVGGYTLANCSVVPPGKPPYKTGHAVQILDGPGKGQWRRVVAVGGPSYRTVTLDAAFDPPPTSASTLQVGQMRGQLLIVGNAFVKGGGVQLYAACYDCVVAQNAFTQFGFSNWGRNPHGTGWQPNLNNMILDNTFANGGPFVNHCSPTCSDPHQLPSKVCSRAMQGSAWLGCSNNGTSNLGRDCAPFSTTGIGSYTGAVNINIAWRRNKGRHLNFGGASENTSWMAAHGIPLAQGGVVERNTPHCTQGPGCDTFDVLNLNRTRDIVDRQGA